MIIKEIYKYIFRIKNYPFVLLLNNLHIYAIRLNFLAFKIKVNYNLLINIREINKRTNLANTYFEKIYTVIISLYKY